MLHSLTKSAHALHKPQLLYCSPITTRTRTHVLGASARKMGTRTRPLLLACASLKSCPLLSVAFGNTFKWIGDPFGCSVLVRSVVPFRLVLCVKRLLNVMIFWNVKFRPSARCRVTVYKPILLVTTLPSWCLLWCERKFAKVFKRKEGRVQGT